MLLAVYAFGPVVESQADIEVVQVAIVLNLPPDELTWYANPSSCISLANLLELGKAPVEWHWRPSAWPVSNHVIRRPVRIWSVAGPDVAALDALDGGGAEPLRLPDPDDATANDQLAVELAASLAHLRRVEDSYWEWDWRRDHRGAGFHPEDHLWRAIHGYLDLLAAVQRSAAQQNSPRLY